MAYFNSSPLHRVLMAALPMASVALLAACGSVKDANEKNFTKAVQAYLDTKGGACVSSGFKSTQDLQPFALENQGFTSGPKNQADALVAAGLLTSEPAEVEQKSFRGARTVPGTRYTITDLGKKSLQERPAWNGGTFAAFCTGKLKVGKIKNFSEPGDAMGMRVSRINYTYQLADADAWIQTPALQAVDRDIAKVGTKGSEATEEAVLILTNEGWVHEKLFKK